MSNEYEYTNTTTICAYASGNTMTFILQTGEEQSQFMVTILQREDYAERKEILALRDDKRIKGGNSLLSFGTPDSHKVVEEFKKAGADPENLGKLSNFLNENLRTSKTKEEEHIEGTLDTKVAKVKTEYKKETRKE